MLFSITGNKHTLFVLNRILVYQKNLIQTQRVGIRFVLAGVDGCNSVNYVGKAEPRRLKNLEKEKSINKSRLATKHYPQTKK